VKSGFPQGQVLSIFRVVTGFTFCCHGLQKQFGWFGGHHQAFPSLLWVAGFLELIGGLLILVGLYTRPVAFLLCGEMAVAYFRAHAPKGLLPVVNGGELAVLYCFIFLLLVTSGPGPWSADNLWRRKQ
jgi:putative oxidoreductase